MNDFGVWNEYVKGDKRDPPRLGTNLTGNSWVW